MQETKSDIIARLRKDILLNQENKGVLNTSAIDAKLGPLKTAFPNDIFPSGAIHEFIYAGPENSAATGGFVAGLFSSLMNEEGVAIWINPSRSIFPPALKLYGIAPEKIIFIDLQKEKEILWAMEEALKCNGLIAVIGELKELSFTASRRLQLAVEQSSVTGFILRSNPRNFNTSSCAARWKITSLPSGLADDLPGVGFPRWNVELLKVKNGKPGNWQIELANGQFRHIYKIVSIPQQEKKKTG